jgi:hypothetical protein
MMGVCIDRKAQSDQLKLIMVTELMSRGEHRLHLLAFHLSSSAHWLFFLWVNARRQRIRSSAQGRQAKDCLQAAHEVRQGRLLGHELAAFV